MKKLMIAAAIACTAALSQAAVYSWRPGATAVNDGTGGSTATTMTLAYLFNSIDYSQQTLLDALNGGTSWSSVIGNAVGETSLTKGANTSYAPLYDTSDAGTLNASGNSVPNYFAIYNAAANKVFLIGSKDTSVPGDPDDKAQITFSNYGTPSKSTFTTTTFASTGWYTVSSTPEPTSGLLLLLGVAGLALRRRRA